MPRSPNPVLVIFFLSGPAYAATGINPYAEILTKSESMNSSELMSLSTSLINEATTDIANGDKTSACRKIQLGLYLNFKSHEQLSSSDKYSPATQKNLVARDRLVERYKSLCPGSSLLTTQSLRIPPSNTEPALAGWTDVTTRFETILGNSSYSPVYYKTASVRNLRSVNFKRTIYRRAVFSYSLSGSTYRQTYLFDCEEANYKTSDMQPGYWTHVNWITPSTSRTSFEWAAYKYLCPTSNDPWFQVVKNVDGERYFVNTGTGYTFSTALYGKVKTWVMVKAGKSNSQASANASSGLSWPLTGYDNPDLMKVYVSCQKRLMSIYSLDGPRDQDVTLDDPNPGSIAEGIVKSACAY